MPAKPVGRKQGNLTPTEQLRCDLTRTTDNSLCSYEEVIAELKHQLNWWKKAQRDEMHDVKGHKCASCGTTTDAPSLLCPKCGTALQLDWLNCPKCEGPARSSPCIGCERGLPLTTHERWPGRDVHVDSSLDPLRYYSHHEPTGPEPSSNENASQCESLFHSPTSTYRCEYSQGHSGKHFSHCSNSQFTQTWSGPAPSVLPVGRQLNDGPTDNLRVTPYDLEQAADPSPQASPRQPRCPKCYEGVTFTVRLDILQSKPLAISCGVCKTFLGLWDSLPALQNLRSARVSYWLDNFSAARPRLLLHGISMTAEGDPVIPRMNDLIRKSEDNVQCHEFQWLEGDKKWIPIKL